MRYSNISSHNLVCPVYKWKKVRDTNISHHNQECPVYSCKIRDRFTYFSPQLSMCCISLTDTWPNYLFLHTIRYAPHIPARYLTFNNFSPQLSMPCIFLDIHDRLHYFFKKLSTPCIFLAHTRRISLFLHTRNYTLHIYGR